MMNRLNERIKELSAPIVVGLDPTLKLIPEWILKEKAEEFGETAEAIKESILVYNKGIIDAVCDLVPAVKPQIAMYEQFGIEGLIAYEKTVKYAKSKGLIVIGDAKRGDIGSTSEAYANAHLGSVMFGNSRITGFDTDILTVNPYLGTDGIKPFVDVCAKEKKGIFVLVKTSNPSSGEFQDAITDGMPLYEKVGKMVEKWGEETREGRYSNVGAVIGATYPEMGKRLRNIMKNTFFLVPGYGAQGGTAKDLLPYFDEEKGGAVVNSSRGIIGAYKQEKYARFGGGKGFAEAARAAVLDMKDDLGAALS